ncbi:MAG: class I SAM-dependent methyltransferase [Candidatus Moranbacteria bacterium]|nr:class I SAM-dependent methyltransferase [Candidatus Moranbacteria bacterium]
MASIQRTRMRENWKELAKAWAKFMPPGKPSVGEIAFFEQEIKNKLENNKTPCALILGSTPEFRDLLAKYGINTTIVDINPDSVRAMTSLMALKNEKEKVVISDWLNMPIKDGTFDFVMSDSAQDNIKFSEFEAFFEKIARVLKPGGEWFFGAINVHRDDVISFKEYVDSYKNNPGKFNDFRYFLLQIIRLAYNEEFYNEENRLFDFHKIELKIKELADKGLLPAEAVGKLTIGVDYQQPMLSEEEFKNMLSKKFTLISEFRDKTHPAMRLKWTAILKKA